MNKNLFKTKSNPPKTDTINNAGGLAYKLGDEETLAQLVCTGCFNNTFYTKGKDQLDLVITLAKTVDVKFLGNLAVYARTDAYMKDSPAVLMAVLATRAPALFTFIAPLVIDNMKMVRNLITVVRSGKIGRKSLGSCMRKYIKKHINSLTDDKLIQESIGQSPSMKDIISLVHPKPMTPARDAYFKYLFGNKYEENTLPKTLIELEAFKNGSGILPQNIDWRQLTAHNLTESHWKQIAVKMNWHALRMNLNNLKTNKVFEDKTIVKIISEKLNNKSIINKIKLFPYQIYNTIQNTNDLPTPINNSLQDALEISISNLPRFENIDKLFICIDYSSSMNSPATGDRGSVTSKVTCCDVAAVYAGAITKANQNLDIDVITFHTSASKLKINPRDSILTLCSSMRGTGGGTDVSSAFEFIKNTSLNKKDRIGIIVISDNESWVDYHNRLGSYNYGTSSAQILETISKKVKSVKTVLLDITPNNHTQIKESTNVLNIGGFSDSIFSVIHRFIDDTGITWVDTINNIDIKNKLQEKSNDKKNNKQEETTEDNNEEDS